MAKRKIGLHKEISTIFDGVPLPNSNGRNGDAGDSGGRGHGAAGHIPPRPIVPPPKAVVVSGGTEVTKQEELQPQKESAGGAVKRVWVEQFMPLWERFKIKVLTPRPGVSEARHKTMVALVPVLLVVALFVFSRLFSGPSKSVAKTRVKDTKVAVKVEQDEIDWKIPEPYPLDLRDPMKRGHSSFIDDSSGELAVRGIVYSEDRPSAVVGTQIVYEGDTIMGVTVVKINRDSVEFEQNGKRWIQKIQQ